MERRVIFSGWVCPAVLLLPQLAVTIVFFFWPAGQAVLQWIGNGTLEEATNVTGPWTPSSSQNNPQIRSATGTRFYRLHQ